MTDNFEDKSENTQIDLARDAGNTWTFDEKEMEMYVADGTAAVAVAILDRKTRQVNGVTMVHHFKWEKNDPFLIREQDFTTKMKTVGRGTEQEIDTTNMTEPNAKLYAAIVQSGVMIIPRGNGETEEKEVSRTQLLEFARLYPESASEVVETWLDGWHFEVMGEEECFDYMFEELPTVKVFGWIGNRDNPVKAVILTFTSPSKEERTKFEDERQIIKSDRIGDQKFAEVRQSFIKQYQYGRKFLKDVHGSAVGAPGVKYTPELKDRFITYFNPITFCEAVEKMHESFGFMQGKAAGS